VKPRVEVLLAIFLFGGTVSFRLIRPSTNVLDGNRMDRSSLADVAMGSEEPSERTLPDHSAGLHGIGINALCGLTYLRGLTVGGLTDAGPAR